ncbi:MAG TPA: amino acid permease [Bryobacteraceae bacterium]|nr:amino acid permease [Bryobacteraceae bacterium]
MPLARQLNLFDITMIVMGGIIGSGIFMNPYVVAQQVPIEGFIIGVWIFGGVVAMAGAFVYADLAARNTAVGGQYAYLRDAWHPSVAFLYGWCLLLVIQTGGMAAVAVTFAHYLIQMTGSGWPPALIAAVTLVALGGVNVAGVRAGTSTQNVLMVLKILAIAALIAAGLFVPIHPETGIGVIVSVRNIGGALTPVLFAYGGWQTASFLSGEMKNPRRDLARGLILGVSGVVILYVAVNWVCVRALGADGLAHTPTPASAVMTAAFGSTGGRLVAAGIAVSTLGFLSQSMLTAPRIYYAMARDGVFFQKIGTLYERTQAPAAAIALQAVLAAGIAFTGRYDQILNYVVSIDFIFFGLTGAALFRKSRPAHPLTTVFFVAACWITVLATIFKSPGTSFIGLGILAAGVPVYFLWTAKNR